MRKTDTQSNLCVCAVPNTMFEKPGVFHFGLFAFAPDGTVKASSIAEYRVIEGIRTSCGSGRDKISATAMKSKFIRLINADVCPGLLKDEMDFDNEIEPTFTNYMSELQAELSDFGSLLNGLFNVIKEYIYPDAEPESQHGLAAFAYLYIIEDFINNSVSKVSFDSVSEDLDASNGLIAQLSAELEQKNTIIENIRTIFETLYSGDDINSNT